MNKNHTCTHICLSKELMCEQQSIIVVPELRIKTGVFETLPSSRTTNEWPMICHQDTVAQETTPLYFCNSIQYKSKCTSSLGKRTVQLSLQRTYMTFLQYVSTIHEKKAINVS